MLSRKNPKASYLAENFLEDSQIKKTSTRPYLAKLVASVSIVFTLLIAVLSVFQFAQKDEQILAYACIPSRMSLGHGIGDARGFVNVDNLVGSELTNRVWTLQEAFSHQSTLFTGWSQEDSPGFLLFCLRPNGRMRDESAPGPDEVLRGDLILRPIYGGEYAPGIMSAAPGQGIIGVSINLGNHEDEEHVERLIEARRFTRSMMGGIATWGVNVNLSIANSINSAGRFIVTTAFSGTLICDPTSEADQGFCLPLIEIIAGDTPGVITGGTGGTGAQGGGLIGAMTTNLYLPLLVLMVLWVAIWIAKKGLIDRKFHEAISGLAWMLGSIVIGLFFLWQPMLMVTAPLTLAQTLGSCIIAAFNGINCLDDNTGSSEGMTATPDPNRQSSELACSSIRTPLDGVPITERPALTSKLLINVMACRIWIAFSVNAYSQAEFGRSFNEMSTMRDEWSETLSSAGLAPVDFCVNLQSSRPAVGPPNSNPMATSRRGQISFLYLDGHWGVCNVIAYQMMLQTRGQNVPPTSPDFSSLRDSQEMMIPSMSTSSAWHTDNDNVPSLSRWWRVIAFASYDEALWETWAPPASRALTNGFAVGVLAIIASIASVFVLGAIGIYAMVYYISAALLMSMAPLFLLLGVHPGMGKKIMLGWLEKIVSNILKYMASAMFLIVTISFYDAVLGAATGFFVSLFMVLLISFALFMYRKEIVELIGRVNMGGTQLSNTLVDKVNNRKDRAINSAKRTGAKAAAIVPGAAMGAVGAKLAGGRASEGAKASAVRGLNTMLPASGAMGQAVRQYQGTKQEIRKDKQQTAAMASNAKAELKDKVAASDEALHGAKDEFGRPQGGGLKDKLDGLAQTLDTAKNDEANASSRLDQLVGADGEVAVQTSIVNNINADFGTTQDAAYKEVDNYLAGMGVNTAEIFDAHEDLRSVQRLQELNALADSNMGMSEEDKLERKRLTDDLMANGGLLSEMAKTFSPDGNLDGKELKALVEMVADEAVGLQAASWNNVNKEMSSGITILDDGRQVMGKRFEDEATTAEYERLKADNTLTDQQKFVQFENFRSDRHINELFKRDELITEMKEIGSDYIARTTNGNFVRTETRNPNATGTSILAQAEDRVADTEKEIITTAAAIKYHNSTIMNAESHDKELTQIELQGAATGQSRSTRKQLEEQYKEEYHEDIDLKRRVGSQKKVNRVAGQVVNAYNDANGNENGTHQSVNINEFVSLVNDVENMSQIDRERSATAIADNTHLFTKDQTTVNAVMNNTERNADATVTAEDGVITVETNARSKKGRRNAHEAVNEQVKNAHVKNVEDISIQQGILNAGSNRQRPTIPVPPRRTKKQTRFIGQQALNNPRNNPF